MLYFLLKIKYEKYIIQIVVISNILLILLFSQIKYLQNTTEYIFIILLSFILFFAAIKIYFTKSIKNLFLFFILVVCLISIKLNFIDPYNQSIVVNNKVVTLQANVIRVTNDELILKTDYGNIKTYIYQNKIIPGMVISGDFKLLKTTPLRNPGGFDEFKYYQSKGIYIKSEIEKNTLEIISLNKNIYYYSFLIKSSLKNTFEDLLGEEQASLLNGILLGDKSNISKENKEMLAAAGLSHIVAVSGMVISIIILPMKSASKKIFTKINFRRIFLVIMLLIFGFVVGFTPSLSRAIIMVISQIIACFLIRKVTLFQSLSIAVLVVTLFKPEFILSVGFWLSTFATFGIIFFLNDFKRILNKCNLLPEFLVNSIALTLSVMIMISPILYYLAGDFSLASVLSNLLVLPILPLVVFLGLLLPLIEFIVIFKFLLVVIYLPLNGILTYLLGVASFVSKIEVIRFDLGKYGIYLALLISTLTIIRIKKAYEIKFIFQSISLLVIIIFISNLVFNVLNKPDLEIIFVDVGQGDCTLIMASDDFNILIDSGSNNKGENVIEPLLNHYNIKGNLTYFTTHIHEDHCGSMPYIFSKFKGDKLFVPYHTKEDVYNNLDNKDFEFGVNLINAANDLNIQVIEVGEGDTIRINNELFIEIFNPSKFDSTNREKGGNASSLVIKLNYNEYSILIMGDATKEVENKLLESEYNISANIYRISHHGSQTTTNHDIINKVNPSSAIISVGNNYYGHPSPEVIERLENSVNNIYRTDINGAIIYTFKNNKVFKRTMLK